MLDLAFAGDAAVDVAQLHGIHAFVVEALAQLPAQPAFEHMLAQFKLVQQRFRRGFARERIIVAAHAVVGEAHAQVSAVHPLGNIVVVLVVDQQRQRETAQHALDGTLPALLFRADWISSPTNGNAASAMPVSSARRARSFCIGAGMLDGVRCIASSSARTSPKRRSSSRLPPRRSLIASSSAEEARWRSCSSFCARSTSSAKPCASSGSSAPAAVPPGVPARAWPAPVALSFGTTLLAFQFLDALTALLAALQLQFGQALGVIVQCSTALGFFAKQAAVTHVHLAQARFDQRRRRLSRKLSTPSFKASSSPRRRCISFRSL